MFPAQQSTFYNPKTCNTYKEPRPLSPVFLGQNRQNPFKDTPERTERLSKVHKILCTESVEAPGPTILLISSSTNRPAGTCDTYKGPRSLSPVFLGHNQQNPFKDTQVSTERPSKIHVFLCTESVESPRANNSLGCVCI